MSDLFHWFLLALRFSATNSGMKKTLMISTGRCGLKLYVQNIFRKRITNMRFWIIYILVQVSFFCGTALGRFCQFFFVFFLNFLLSVNHGGQHFTKPPSPHHKKAFYGPAYYHLFCLFQPLYIYFFFICHKFKKNSQTLKSYALFWEYFYSNKSKD